jgi:hypothetical protein
VKSRTLTEGSQNNSIKRLNDLIFTIKMTKEDYEGFLAVKKQLNDRVRWAFLNFIILIILFKLYYIRLLPIMNIITTIKYKFCCNWNTEIYFYFLLSKLDVNSNNKQINGIDWIKNKIDYIHYI